MFNKQQFDRLQAHHSLRILVPVAWPDYMRHRKSLRAANSEHLRYVCFWYTPKLLYSLFGWFMYLSTLIGASRWLRRQSTDMVLGSWAFPDGFVASRLAKKLRCKYVIKVHGSDINVLTEDPARLKRIVRVCREAKAVLAVSKALKAKLVNMGVPDGQITQIYNGVDSRLFYPDSSGSNDYFLYIGNLKRDKGVLDLYDAYSEYRREGGTRPLIYVGGGAEFQNLQGRIHRDGLENHIRLLGPKPHAEAARLLRGALALILPSYHEGVPNVLLEAAACGKPVLATRVGGIPEVVIEGKTGRLVSPGDTEALAKGLVALQDAGVWNGAAIMQHGQGFSWSENIQSLRAVLES